MWSKATSLGSAIISKVFRVQPLEVSTTSTRASLASVNDWVSFFFRRTLS